MTHDDLLKLEATAIYDELQTRVEANEDIKDLMLLAQLSRKQQEMVSLMLVKAVCQGFRVGLEYERE